MERLSLPGCDVRYILGGGKLLCFHLSTETNSHQSSIVIHSLGKMLFKICISSQKSILAMKYILIVCYVTCPMIFTLIEFFSQRILSIHKDDRRVMVSQLKGQYIPHVEFLVYVAKNDSTGFPLQFWMFDLCFGVGDESRKRLHFPKTDKLTEKFSEAYHLIIVLVYYNKFRQKISLP